MRVDLFDFDLPDERIALRPANPRDSARMLRISALGALSDHLVSDLANLLEPGDALVFNDTKVIPAQLEGFRFRGENSSRISVTLHMRTGPDRWLAFVRPGKRVKEGDRLIFGGDGSVCMAGVLDGTAGKSGEGGEQEIIFDFSGPMLDDAVLAAGHIPLPPYIASKRGEDDQDKTDYQTIYAREDGAVAAPTAGLHFTEDLFAALDARGVSRHFVTLHVGAGTFLPVKADDTDDHKMHSEIGEVSAEVAQALNEVKACGGRIVSVGTTSLRLLESAADETGRIKPWSGPTDIFITPGYRFRAIDVLMTNFHLPRSTLFMLVSAFCGFKTMRDAYDYAISEGYRFYSYGDSSLLFRTET